MRHIPRQALATVALGAEEVVAEAALVAGGDASTAFIAGTGHEEVGTGCFRLYHRLFFCWHVGVIDETIVAPLGVEEALLCLGNLLLDPTDLLAGGLLELLILCRLLEITHMGLGFRQQRIPLVVPILLVHEGPAQGRAQELHIPLGGTEHALGHHHRVLEEIGLDTLVTCRLLAVGTRHAAVRRAVELFHTDGAVRHDVIDLFFFNQRN